VYEESLDLIRARGSVLWPRNLFAWLFAWSRHFRVEMQLGTYETWLKLRALAGLRQVDVANSFRE
jgi:ABC-type transport system involved in cytochrome c biogenesis permease component